MWMNYLFFLCFIQIYFIFSEELSDDIVIIHLNDVHCGITDKIGYDGFVLYRRELEKKYKKVITVDVGDHIQGGTLGAISDGEAIIKIMNEVNFDVAILGNHEFDYRLDQLYKLGDNITSKYICSNFCYKKNKTHIFNPYKIIEAGNQTIGFIGVVTPLTFSKTYLSTLKDENGDAIYDFLVNDGKQELYDTVQKYIDELRNEKNVSYVILLTHMGMNIEAYTSNDLLANLKGVDAVFDGHTHKVYNVTSNDKEKKAIHITQTGTKLETIGQLIIKTDGSLIAETILEVPKPDSDISGAINVTRSNKERWVDKNMSDFMANVHGEYEEILNTIIGKSDYDLIILPEGKTDSRDVYCRIQECTLGNLIADSVVAAGKGDLAIINGGGVRHNLQKGNITKGNIIEMLPWFNNIVIKELPGQTILDALEFGVTKYPLPSGGFPQVSSNVTYRFNPDINSTVETDNNGLYLNITGERRVSNVKINGEALDPKKIYNVVLFEFMAIGGDGYSMLSEYDVSREALVTDTQALSDFIEEDLKRTIPEKYSQLQGRINITNETETEQINDIYRNIKKNKSGLSAGIIIAIILPGVAALSIIAILAFVMKGNVAPPQAIPSLGSEDNFASKV
jgi:2',3'-cyclic-nucleotide 2'-phosphodiesterase (5'-nucleotidase family)